MHRLHLFELEDQPWVPTVWRDGATDVLDVLFAKAGIYRPLAPVLAGFMDAVNERAWFDLGSGGGGGALAMRAELAALGRAPERITLTDRYPNDAARARVVALGETGVDYLAGPVDALDVPVHPPAIRTMFGAVHHFPPALVRRLLTSAIDAGTPLAFVDVAASPVLRKVPVALALLAALPNLVMLFIVALALVPLARPFRWSRLLLDLRDPGHSDPLRVGRHGVGDARLHAG